MNRIKLYALTIGAISVAFTSCSNHDDAYDAPSKTVSHQYVIAAKPLASDGVADYLLTADNLSKGQVSLAGNGIEQDGTFRYYATNNNRFFSMLYGRGTPGAVTAYELNPQGELVELTDFQSETVAAFAPVDDDILMMDIPRDGSPMATWYRLSTESLTFTAQGQIDVFELTENDGQAFFTGMTDVDDYVFAPFMTMKMCCNDEWGTNYPDKAWIAVFNYPEMTLEKVIKDDRTSFIGKYFTSGLQVVENGDVYVFSSAIADSNGAMTSTKPSAVTRIKQGTLAFDESYYFDLEEASGGYYATSKIYAGHGNFLLQMRSVSKRAPYADGKKLAIINIHDNSFTWVTGVPSAAQIVNVAMVNLVSDDGKTIHIGLTTEQGSYVFNVNVASASATMGLQVVGGMITAISELNAVAL